MCGLFGYTTKRGVKLTPKQKAQRQGILTSLAISMQERGTHSTGVAGMFEKTYTVGIVKQAERASEFVQIPEWDKLLKKDPRVVIGHTRYATVGEINNDNAHPFQEGNIIGAHNGSVWNWQEVNSQADVDSQAIFHALNEHDNDYKKALAELRGKFAITWLDLKNLDKLHLVVDGNPLHIVRVPEIETYFWCSLEYPLQAAIAGHFSLKGKTIWSPHSEQVYTIDGKHQIKKTEIAFKQYVAPTVTQHAPLITSGKDDYSKSHAEWTRHKQTWESMLDEEESEDMSNARHGGSGVDYKSFSKINDLTLTEMKAIVDQCHECQFCQTPIDTENDVFYWHETEKLILCEDDAEALEEWNYMLRLECEDLIEIDDVLWNTASIGEAN